MITNLTNKKILAKKSKKITNPFLQAIGLMFQKPKPVIFCFSKPRHESIHMMFCFWPLDILLLDQNKKVIALKESLKPFTIYNPKQKIQYIIELPTQTIHRTQTKLGDKLSF